MEQIVFHLLSSWQKSWNNAFNICGKLKITQLKAKDFANKNLSLITRIVFGFILMIVAFRMKSPQLFFFILSIPQIFRRTFEKIINPMKMREIRIFFGPAAVLLQLLMLQKPTAFIKIIGLLYGILSIPQKNQQYAFKKRRHGIAMTIVFGVTCVELLLS